MRNLSCSSYCPGAKLLARGKELNKFCHPNQQRRPLFYVYKSFSYGLAPTSAGVHPSARRRPHQRIPAVRSSLTNKEEEPSSGRITNNIAQQSLNPCKLGVPEGHQGTTAAANQAPQPDLIFYLYYCKVYSKTPVFHVFTICWPKELRLF